MKSFLKNTILFFMLVLLINGCGGKNNSKTIAEKKSEKKIVESSQVIKKLNTALLKKFIAERNGKILIVDLWSTWSGKSMNQLLILNDLYERYKNNLVDFIVITVDSENNIDSKVVPFLKKENVKFPVYTIDSGSGKKVMNLLNPEWNGSIPIMYFYNAKGIRKKILKGLQTQANIEESINEMTN